MKRIVLVFLLFPSFLFAQNVGIGTTTPQSTLDIKGNTRLGGVNNFLTYDSTTGRFSWSNSYLWITNPQYIIRHSASSEGLFYSNQQLEYRRSDGSISFSTNWNTNQTYVRGNLAVGLTTPSAKVHIIADAGDAVRIEGPQPVLTMYNSGVHTTYLKSHAFGIDLGSPAGRVAPIRLTPGDNAIISAYPSGMIRMEGLLAPGDLSISIGGNGDFQVDANGLAGGRFAIRENGNVGIGNPYPFEKLDVFGNIRADGYKYVNPKLYYYSMDPSSFKPRNGAVVYREESGGYLESSAIYTTLIAPVNLPHAAVVTKITANVYDASGPINIGFYLYGYNASGFQTYQSADIVSSGSPGYLALQTSAMGTILDNSSLSYGISFYTTSNWPGNLITIRSVIIEYTLNEL